jgi:hypothetical protein
MARALEDLAMIGLVLDETDTSNAHRYTLAPGVDLLALLGSPEMSPHQQEEGGEG